VGTVPDRVEYIPGKTDTVVRYHRDTVKKIVYKPYPVAVFKAVPDSGTPDFLCDSVRIYTDSAKTPYSKATVGMKVRGELLDHRIMIETHFPDTLFSRVDTVKITRNYPYSVSFGLHGIADLNNGFGAGVNIGLNRLNLSYSYFPVNKSNQISLGYMIFRK
jgi:hypothetical protein